MKTLYFMLYAGIVSLFARDKSEFLRWHKWGKSHLSPKELIHTYSYHKMVLVEAHTKGAPNGSISKILFHSHIHYTRLHSRSQYIHQWFCEPWEPAFSTSNRSQSTSCIQLVCNAVGLIQCYLNRLGQLISHRRVKLLTPKNPNISVTRMFVLKY